MRQYPQRRPGSVAHQTNQCPKAKNARFGPKTSRDNRVCRHLWRESQINKMCLQTSPERCCWSSWPNKEMEPIPQSGAARAKSPCTSVGLNLRDREVNIYHYLISVNGVELTGLNIAFKWSGWFSLDVLQVSRQVLNSILNLIGSHCSVVVEHCGSYYRKLYIFPAKTKVHVHQLLR